MITKFQNFKLIKESPDTLTDVDDTDYTFSDDDARPFFVEVNKNHTKIEKVYVGGHRDWHSDIDYDGENKAYAGRLWEDRKIMSFWVYPSVPLFKQIIAGLERELDIKIFNNGWEIEVIIDENSDNDGIVKYKYMTRPEIDDGDDEYYEEEDFFRPDDQPYGDPKIIPIEEYGGSENTPEKFQILHLMKCQDKELLKKLGKFHFPKGFGSDKTAWDSPYNIRYRQAIRTSENNKN